MARIEKEQRGRTAGRAPVLRVSLFALALWGALTARNGPDAPMAKESLAIDFSKPDRIPMQLMNEILWKNVKGAESEMPSTRHTAVAIHPRFEDARAADGQRTGE
jgi:hypothetical protein